MTEEHYKNREIDEKFSAVHKRFDLQDTALENILEQTTDTNGKVKKIIIAFAVMLGIGLGISGKEVLPVLLKLFI